ncbi:hypothetical protein SAMN05443634_1048 [Chishuiella changwenlii]|uniref:Uncharacterized protein n=2 Tax=Chishuiella changwenlii TaxID=1434701 RepID=A0A1M6VRI2_9FLAO|nr:hypothetical protein [Chishuiella changwenlii]SHK84069.1 hypothetical protein SAMN05443634_1048 [Chishuiella changwenlii]
MITKNLNVILILFFQMMSLTAFSQKKAELNSLLDKNNEFVFPQTASKISKALNTKTVYYEDANDEKYAKWLPKSGLEVYCSIGNDDVVNEIFFDVADDKVSIIEGLPYNLALNKTTLQESKTKFKKYNAEHEKLGEDTSFSGGSKLIFKNGKYYTTLIFDNKDLLKFIGITTELVPAGAG